MSKKNPVIPGTPGSGTPTVAEPTEPTEPLPPKSDQRAPALSTATGQPVDGPDTARGQQGERLTTAQGARLYDTDHSLKAGERGPTLLQDHHLREKITHFDHERIPERVVHARGAAAHGVFRGYGSAEPVSKAAFLAKDVETQVFVRFSTVLGSRGSADAVRDTRGFATKFYTAEGTFDLVGNNIPVFFIQDGIKFPDIIHAGKPHPDREIPQAQSAHDTFWDFVSLHTEATAHTLWNMSDRGIPRSYRMMEGFGVNTFRMVNAAGESSLVKFHWKPKLGVHSLVWEEAQIVNGMDPDYHRRDLADAIESGAYPQWELGIQAFPDTADQMFEGIDLLDPTKIVPEELAPVQPLGLMTLNANPTNFFAETEQVAFHPGHLVPGIDVTDDPLLQARLFSYLDTQISRLGGPNFGQIPINRPHAEVNDMLRDGMHQTGVHPGVAPYRPNSLDGGCPFLAGADTAFVEVPVPMPESTKLRGAPASYDDHFSQARLFYASLTPVEQSHVAEAYTFELGKCYEQAIKERALGVVANIDPGLCATVAEGLGLPAPEPTVAYDAAQTPSPALSQVGAEWPLDGRIIGIVADDESDLSEVADAVEKIDKDGMVPLVIGPHGGELGSGKSAVPVSRTFLTMRSVEFDAVLVATQVADPRVLVLLTEAFRHCKAIGGWGAGRGLLDVAGIPADAPGVVIADEASALFDGVTALMKSHRVWARQE
ncbi:MULTISPECIES: catalase [unclassified Rhodococcus (in: high G+C Gram-positive bacteria)]|uniref:catalase n=1 Tax=unclassified Rhodococcus (in: high G+C Gram-positive bacteria) TaxID=192944 RepID=UPI001639E4D8|nr:MULTISPECIES: catalase [unclassified Rhodococcus (in: high G+C Gram-positive bacteria)]MBC2641028.1 catalase [Rhodococcus sp. 3A]MBC2894227.1 catalase [Rhodococcus sp. 4CII]